MGSAPRAADLLPRCCPRAGSERPRTSARRGAQRSRVGCIFWTVDCARALLEPRQRERQLGLGELKGGGVRASSWTCACEAGRPSQSRVSAHAGPGLSVLACELRRAWSWNQPPSATCELAGAGGVLSVHACSQVRSRWRGPPGAREATAMRRCPGLICGALHMSRALRSANSRLSGRRPSRPDSASVAGSGAERLAGGAGWLKRGSYSRVPLHETHF